MAKIVIAPKIYLSWEIKFRTICKSLPNGVANCHEPSASKLSAFPLQVSLHPPPTTHLQPTSATHSGHPTHPSPGNNLNPGLRVYLIWLEHYAYARVFTECSLCFHNCRVIAGKNNCQLQWQSELSWLKGMRHHGF